MQNLRGGQFVAGVDGVVHELNTSQVTDTLAIDPVNEEIINGSLLVLVDQGGVVGVGEGARDVAVGPGATPVIPDGDTAEVLDGKVVSGGEEALLSVVGLSTAGVREGDPGGGAPVRGAHGLLDSVEDEGALGVVTDHVGDILDLIDDDAWLLEHWWGFWVPFALGITN